MRRIFIGDIHGCLGAFERLLEAVAFRPGEDRLLPVGDLLNKGPDSMGVLRLAHALGAEPVVGNHDLLWLERGKITDPDLERWVRSWPVVRFFDDILMVHAGLHPHWTEEDLQRLDDDQRDYAVNVRYCTADGVRPSSDWPPPPDPPFAAWDTHYSGSRTVVFGHWARRGLDRGERAIALDSGCVYGGALSAYIPETESVVQVDA